MTTSSRQRRSLIGRTPAGMPRTVTPQVQVGAEVLEPLPEGEGSNDEPLEALAVEDFDEEWFDDDDDDEEWEEDDDDPDSEISYTAPRLGLRIGAGSSARVTSSARADDVSDIADIADIADIVDAVADDAVIAEDTGDVPIPDRTPDLAARGADVLPDVSGLEVKEVHREGSFTTDGRPLDSEVMAGDDPAFAITIEPPTQPRRPGPRRNDQALPYLALATSTAGLLAGASITAVGLLALVSILTALGDDDPPPEDPMPVVAPDEPEEEEEPIVAPPSGTDEASTGDTGDTGMAEEEEEEAAPAPRRRRRRPAPEPEPEPEPEPVQPEPEPEPEPEPVQPEPEPEPEKKRRGLFGRRKKKDK